MTKRIYNFSAGPCTLPLTALEDAQKEFVDFQNAGMSVIEMSHRSKEYDAVHTEALALTRELLAIPDDFAILFVGGGATLQFSMIPMNLCPKGKKGAYAVAGTWGKKAFGDGKVIANGYAAWDGADEKYTRMPEDNELKLEPDTAYLHVTSNETIGGIRYLEPPKVDVPLISDMSSDYMSRPVPWDKYIMVYAGAQKNIGPSGLAVVIIKKDVIPEAPEGVGAYLRYHIHATKDSLYNTPPVFQIYMMGKVLKWVKAHGGLEGMGKLAAERSGILYDAMATSDGYYRNPVKSEHRSLTNVVFRLPNEDLEKQFIAEALAQGMSGLKGHRSVGGCRASMYNAMPVEGAKAVADFMKAFKVANPA